NFNAGWSVEVDPRNSTQVNAIPHYQNYSYHIPQFTWIKPVGPTGISFVDSDKLPNYKNSVFVGDCNNGNLYKFDLNPARDGFVFKSPQLQHNIANLGDSMDEIIFGTGFGCITDIKEGPDGFVYIISYSDGTIYRIIPPRYVDPVPLFGNYLYVVILTIAAGSALFILYLKRTKKKFRFKNMIGT
ncbi:MAG: PQQ-dependent sugar dehydrogenase, partial [Patescibacteria group bacterium]|nr:PQQ-dependent sugar dehydrogenase [Patescibacteria group bacterium]